MSVRSFFEGEFVELSGSEIAENRVSRLLNRELRKPFEEIDFEKVDSLMTLLERLNRINRPDQVADHQGVTPDTWVKAGVALGAPIVQRVIEEHGHVVDKAFSSMSAHNMMK